MKQVLEVICQVLDEIISTAQEEGRWGRSESVVRELRDGIRDKLAQLGRPEEEAEPRVRYALYQTLPNDVPFLINTFDKKSSALEALESVYRVSVAGGTEWSDRVPQDPNVIKKLGSSKNQGRYMWVERKLDKEES